MQITELRQDQINKEKKKVKKSIKTIICIVMVGIIITSCGTKTEVNAKSRAEEYVYNPSNMESAKGEYDYVCSFVNAFGETEYLFFNASEARVNYHSGTFYGNYTIKNTNINLWTSGSCLYIGECNDKTLLSELKNCDVYTDFAIQKLNRE